MKTEVTTKIFELGGAEPLFFTSLPQDASNRRYVRVVDKEKRSWMVMDYSFGPGAFSIEATAKEQVKERKPESDFIEMQAWLESHKVQVPAILAKGDGFLLLEDLGDSTIYQFNQSQRPSMNELTAIYKAALDQLILIHHSYRSGEKGCVATQRQFDANLYNWEFDHFIEYGIDWLLGKSRKTKELRNYFHSLSDLITKWPLCLSHRDYHCKNLLLRQNQTVWVIDFQDALMAPPHYDVASLIFDSYISLPEQVTNELTSYYHENIDHDLLPHGGDDFSTELRIMALQRNLKAAGRFLYIFAEKGKRSHIDYVLPTMKKVESHLDFLGANDEFKKNMPFAEIEERMAKVLVS